MICGRLREDGFQFLRHYKCLSALLHGFPYDVSKMLRDHMMLKSPTKVFFVTSSLPGPVHRVDSILVSIWGTVCFCIVFGKLLMNSLYSGNPSLVIIYQVVKGRVGRGFLKDILNICTRFPLLYHIFSVSNRFINILP